MKRYDVLFCVYLFYSNGYEIERDWHSVSDPCSIGVRCFKRHQTDIVGSWVYTLTPDTVDKVEYRGQ